VVSWAVPLLAVSALLGIDAIARRHQAAGRSNTALQASEQNS
jgi:hypothetical protein